MYGKIFEQMYEGTLASRGPWEALVTFQQLIVLANKHGEVDMTPEAISRRTTIPLEIIQKGIAILEQPDQDSRTPDEDGRRIARLDVHRSWGWRLVNYEKYRKIRCEEERRDYQAKWVATKRSAAKGKMSTVVDNVDPGSMQYAVKPLCNDVAQEGFKPLPIGEGFERFWAVYPRKKGKVAARKAWNKVVKPEEAEGVIARVELNSLGEWLGKDPQFIPHPATWLNGRRWEDEIEQPQEQPRKNSQAAEEQRRKRTESTPEGRAIRARLGQRAEVLQ